MSPDLSFRTVHPRVCGEQVIRDRNCPSGAVHPRVCGEQAAPRIICVVIRGSSPRVRGTGKYRCPQLQRTRFIPACAGNRPRSFPTRPGTPVHPRVCGEQAPKKSMRFGSDGSSPRVRGTGRCHKPYPANWRFIPACAGSRRPAAPSAIAVTVHPRVCGEQTASSRRPMWKCGSSPRVRGTVNAISDHIATQRFIPACAGNSPNGDRREDTQAVHPRVCGEQAENDHIQNI